MGAYCSNGKCVLIVDNNAFTLRRFSAMLSIEGYRVLQATDGPRGIALARREAPDLMIISMNLLGISGLELMRILKDDPDTAGIPIIITASSELRGEQHEHRTSGSGGFVSRPIALSEFRKVIETVIERSNRMPRYLPKIVAADGRRPKTTLS